MSVLGDVVWVTTERRMRSPAWALVQHGRVPCGRRRDRDTQAEGDGDMGTMLEGGHLRDKERGLGRSQGLYKPSLTMANTWGSQPLREQQTRSREGDGVTPIP